MKDSCLFCKIINGEIPSKQIAQNDLVMVIDNIQPQAPIHYLILPKKHIANIASITANDNEVIINTIMMAKNLSSSLESPQAFNLITNNGEQAGQSIFHLHWHFLSGKNIYQDGGLQL